MVIERFERVIQEEPERCGVCGEWSTTEFRCPVCGWRGCGACARLHECSAVMEVSD